MKFYMEIPRIISFQLNPISPTEIRQFLRQPIIQLRKNNRANQIYQSTCHGYNDRRIRFHRSFLQDIRDLNTIGNRCKDRCTDDDHLNQRTDRSRE